MAPPCKCGKQHHPLLCSATQSKSLEQPTTAETNQKNAAENGPDGTETTGTYLVSTGAIALYPIHRAFVMGCTRPITVFIDGGSNASYVTERCPAKMKLRKLNKVSLDVSTLGGAQQTYATTVYEIPLRTQKENTFTVLAYGMKEMTGPLSHLNETVLRELFPECDVQVLLCPSGRPHDRHRLFWTAPIEGGGQSGR